MPFLLRPFPLMYYTGVLRQAPTRARRFERASNPVRYQPPFMMTRTELGKSRMHQIRRTRTANTITLELTKNAGCGVLTTTSIPNNLRVFRIGIATFYLFVLFWHSFVVLAQVLLVIQVLVRAVQYYHVASRLESTGVSGAICLIYIFEGPDCRTTVFSLL